MPSIKPNSFSGTWYIPGMSTKYKGELIHEEDKNFWALHIRDNHNDESLTQLIMQPSKYIQCVLDSGSYILLVNPTARHAGGNLLAYDDYLLLPEFILEGTQADSDIIRLESLAFDFDDAVHWSGMCHFHHRNYGVEWEREPEVILECADHSLTVSPCRYDSMSLIPSREICLSQTVVFKLLPTSERSLEWFLEMANRVKLLTTLGIQRKVALNDLRFLLPEDIRYPNNEERWPTEHSLHINLAEAEEISDTHFLNHLFDFNALKENPEIYSAWMKNYEMMKPVIDLRCLIFLYPDSPAEVVFLNLMQALETYHARFICDNLKKYPPVVNHHVDKNLGFYDEQYQEEYRAYLLENTSNSYITLQTRLRFLFSIERFLYIPPANKCNLKSFIQKLVNSRHYYTHYDPKKERKSFTRDELPAVNALISTLLDYHVLKEIDFPQEKLVSLIHKRFARLDNLIDDSLYQKNES